MLWLFSGMKDDIEKFRQWELTAQPAAETAGQPQVIKIG